MNSYNTIKTSIGRVSIEPTLEHTTSYGEILPLLDYVEKIQLSHHLENYISIRKQRGTYRLS